MKIILVLIGAACLTACSFGKGKAYKPPTFVDIMKSLPSDEKIRKEEHEIYNLEMERLQKRGKKQELARKLGVTDEEEVVYIILQQPVYRERYHPYMGYPLWGGGWGGGGFGSVVPSFSISGGGGSPQVTPTFGINTPQFSTATPQLGGNTPAFNTGVPGFNTSVPGFNTAVPGFNASVPVHRTQAPLQSGTVPQFQTGVPGYQTVTPTFKTGGP